MKNQTESLEHASVRQYCKAVRMPAIGANFLSLAEQAVKENHSHIRYLEALLAMECEERDRHAISNRIRDAQLPRMKTLEEFDFAQAPQISAARIRELAEGGYVERSEPIVLIGEAGTGKSHLATGLCVAACRQKRRVRFTTAAALVNELVEAKQNNQVRRLMSRWQKYRADRAGRSGLRATGRHRRGVSVPGDLGSGGAGGDHRDDQSAIFRVDDGVSEPATLQSSVGSDHGSGAHHRDGNGIVPFPAHDGKEEEALSREKQTRSKPTSRMGRPSRRSARRSFRDSCQNGARAQGFAPPRQKPARPCALRAVPADR